MLVVKTPGVYVEEIALFPPSVAEVATAIPAFIGYTEKAINADLKQLKNIPVKISSLLEYNELFGGPYVVVTYTVSADGNNVVTTAKPDKRFHLYDSLHQFFDNGGGECYIVSVGDYSGTIDAAVISSGMDELKKYDEPTLIVFPDAVEMLNAGVPDFDKMSDLQKKALSLCAAMQDRFAVLDMMQGNLKEDTVNKPISTFRDKVGVNFLNYGTTYYPWIVTNYNIDVNYRNLAFGPILLNTVSHNQAETDLLNAVKDVVSGDGVLKNTDAVTTIAGLDQKKLRTQGAVYLQAELDRLKSEARNAIPADVKLKVTAYFSFLNTLVLAMPQFETALPASSLKTDLVQLKKDKNYINAVSALIGYEKHASILANTTSDITLVKIKGTIFPPLFTGGANAWIVTVLPVLPDTDSIPVNGDPAPATLAGCMQLISNMENAKIISGIINGYATVLNAALYYENMAQNALFSNHTFFKGVSDKIKEVMRTIPPSGTMVGVYAMVDRTRGVWKAPANVSLNAVIGPSVKIDNREQEDLNVHTTGKSINAIRSFTGKGTLVWGARTLAGNDNEWRYIPVRRFFIMVEESVKKASEPFVFEPNDAKTWTKVKTMIENFLTLQWRGGALQGAKPEDAFFVHIGLGETMSQDDVLNGKMIVEIGMAVVRPAEFIILRFSHKMQEAR
jgi:phage tail sheath protein FI